LELLWCSLLRLQLQWFDSSLIVENLTFHLPARPWTCDFECGRGNLGQTLSTNGGPKKPVWSQRNVFLQTKKLGKMNFSEGKRKFEGLDQTLSAESWSFSDAYLSVAVSAWETRAKPSRDRVIAFYDWCLALTESGPADIDTFPIPDDEDGFISYVPSARAFVTFLAVVQDKTIFLRSIEDSE
jgi:hypothetical protein